MVNWSGAVALSVSSELIHPIGFVYISSMLSISDHQSFGWKQPGNWCGSEYRISLVRGLSVPCSWTVHRPVGDDPFLSAFRCNVVYLHSVTKVTYLTTTPFTYSLLFILLTTGTLSRWPPMISMVDLTTTIKHSMCRYECSQRAKCSCMFYLNISAGCAE